jgi:hypothetical protein
MAFGIHQLEDREWTFKQDVTMEGDLTIEGDFTIGDAASDTAAVAGDLRVNDDRFLHFGTDEDVSMEYDEDGTDTLLVTGAAWAITPAVTITGTLAATNAATVGTTLGVTGAATFTAGQQSAAVARTATGDGLTTGIITDGTTYVTVTSASANNIITLPTPTPGNVVWLNVGANGYELRSSAPSSVAINGGTGAGVESAVGANVLVRCVCTSATTWVCNTFTSTGTEAALEAAA